MGVGGGAGGAVGTGVVDTLEEVLVVAPELEVLVVLQTLIPLQLPWLLLPTPLLFPLLLTLGESQAVSKRQPTSAITTMQQRRIEVFPG